MLNRHVPHHKNYANHAGGRIANYPSTDLGVSKHDVLAQLNGSHIYARRPQGLDRIRIQHRNMVASPYHRIKALGIFGSTI